MVKILSNILQLKEKTVNLVDLAYKLKDENKLPAIYFEKNTMACLQLVRNFAKTLDKMEDTKYPKLISDRLRGRRLTPITDEIRIKISDSLKGYKNPNYGKKITEERKEKLREGIKKLWSERKKNNYDVKNNIKGLFNGVNKKAVGKYDDNNNLIEEYESTVDAGLKNNIHHSVISKVCRGVKYYIRAGGFIWKFISDQTLTS